MSENSLEQFRETARSWLQDNFPSSLDGQGANIMEQASLTNTFEGDVRLWVDRLGAAGYGTPTWPKQYGGAGLTHPEAKVLAAEMAKVGAVNPIPMVAGMGVTMVGPTVLEYGSDEQKARHLPPTARGEVRWCLGLSEPNAGSDLASLTTKAEASGDNWIVNGQKTWTSGADKSHWCGVLVRTDTGVKKRDGISFLLLPMDQPGIETRPIKLISGSSPFSETFFDDAIAEKGELLGKRNEGWSVIKRLLQHERQSQTTAGRADNVKQTSLQDLAKQYVGTDAEGRLDDPDLRGRMVKHLMAAKAHKLTVSRITAEARGKVKVSTTASILKNSATSVAQTQAELTMEFMGAQGLGWQGESFNKQELDNVRNWLFGKAMSIYGGSAEVQKNIISKNILGLPETTQKG